MRGDDLRRCRREVADAHAATRAFARRIDQRLVELLTASRQVLLWMPEDAEAEVAIVDLGRLDQAVRGAAEALKRSASGPTPWW